ncbi:MAG: WG repeat-containing protein [Clostridia bacterium]|nr:WG repeat-containing protein [Clostridia bacterium]
MKKIICIFLSIIVIFLFTACSSDPISLGGESDNENPPIADSDNKGNSSNDKGNGNDNASTVQNNKYANIQKIVAAYDDIYIYMNYDGTYGLLSTDGNIIYEGFNLYQPFSEFSNYLACQYDKSAMKMGVSSIIDKKGNTVLAVGENNVEFISDITQGRILVYKMTDERPSGKTYDLICYSAKDMSKIFTLSDQDEINYYIDFDETGYSGSDDVCFDIHGNIYEYKYYSYYDSNGKEYAKQYTGSFSPTTSERYGLPKVTGIEPFVDTYGAWGDLVRSYSEYSNSYNKDYDVGATKNKLGQIATLYMKSTSEWCATMDINGNILMAPTKDIMLKDNSGSAARLYTFSNDLCCAYQPSSDLWGYVDPYGNWIIAPKYNSVTTFSYSGYAVVDDLVVINTTGKIVLDISDKGDIHPLEGKYKSSGAYFATYLTFSKDGTIATSGITGTYEVHGNSLVVDGLGYNSALNDGTHTFEQSGDTLIINGDRWVLQEDQ